MDILTIFRLLRRHWALSTSIIALTVLSAIVLLLLVPRQYQSQASFVLANPPAPPTPEQIAVNPELRNISYNNPYLRFTNDSTVGQVLSNRVGGDVVRQELVDAGADGGYTIGPSTAFGASGQVVDVTATGSSPASTSQTMELVTERMQRELAEMQKIYGASDEALITALPVAEPSAPTVVSSGVVRSLIGVAAAGAVVLFASLSVAERRLSAASNAGGRRRAARQVRRAEALSDRDRQASVGAEPDVVADDADPVDRQTRGVGSPSS